MLHPLFFIISFVPLTFYHLSTLQTAHCLLMGRQRKHRSLGGGIPAFKDAPYEIVDSQPLG